MDDLTRIVLIGPDTVSSKTCEAVLSKQGFQVSVASKLVSGSVRRGDAELFIVDSTCLERLPSEELPQDPAFRESVIVMAGSDFLERMAARDSYPPFEFVRKPVEEAELILRVRAAIARLGRTPAVPRTEETQDRLRLLVDPFRFEAPGDGKDAARIVLDAMGRRLSASGGSFYAVEESGLRLLHSYGERRSPSFVPFPLSDSSVFNMVLHAGHALLMRDIENETTVRPTGWAAYRDPSLLAFPLFDYSGKISALISLHNKTWPPFNHDDLRAGALNASYAGRLFDSQRMAKDLAASQTLVERERGLRNTIIEMSPEYLIAVDESGAVRLINPAMLSATGYTEAETNGRRFVDLFVEPGIRSKASAFLEKLIISLRPGETEAELLTKSGNRFVVKWQYRPVDRRGDEPAMLVAAGRDVTLFKRALTGLQDSQQLFRTMLDHIRYGMLIVDARMRVVYANSMFASFTGRNQGSCVGAEVVEVLTELVGRSPAAKMSSLVGECLASSAPAGSRVFSGRGRYETRRWFEMQVTPIEFPQDIRVAVHLLDITKERVAQRGIVERERRYRTLVHAAPIGILAVDDSGRIVEANKRAGDIFGSPSLSYTKSVNLLRYPRLETAGISADIRQCLKTGATVSRETSFHSRWGRDLVIRYQLTPLTRTRGRISEVQALIEDITEQRLLQEKSLQSQKMESLGTLTGGIAHEFNNLLQVIQGYAEMLSMGYSGKSKEIPLELREIQSASSRAAELTSHLLTFSCNREIARQPIDLNRVVAESVELLLSSLLRFVTVELDLASSPQIVMADPAQIGQIITNLALNTKDALPSDGRVSISTSILTVKAPEGRAQDPIQPGRYVRLRFSDNGRGIEPEVIRSIFDPFFTTKPVGEGHGLGLSVVYGIVKSHHGFLECSSSPGNGTKFDIFLPAYEPTVNSVPEEPLRDQPRRAVGRNEKLILFVDDEPALRGLAEQFLSDLGYRVLLAESAEAAVERVKTYRGSIDLVILDLVMPGKGGEWCLRELLAIDPALRILVSSGYSIKSDISDLMTAGARGLIRKPYDLSEFSSLVRSTIEAEG